MTVSPNRIVKSLDVFKYETVYLLKVMNLKRFNHSRLIKAWNDSMQALSQG